MLARHSRRRVHATFVAPGRLAQLGERRLDKAEVAGSSPASSIRLFAGHSCSRHVLLIEELRLESVPPIPRSLGNRRRSSPPRRILPCVIGHGLINGEQSQANAVLAGRRRSLAGRCLRGLVLGRGQHEALGTGRPAEQAARADRSSRSAQPSAGCWLSLHPVLLLRSVICSRASRIASAAGMRGLSSSSRITPL